MTANFQELRSSLLPEDQLRLDQVLVDPFSFTAFLDLCCLCKCNNILEGERFGQSGRALGRGTVIGLHTWLP